MTVLVSTDEVGSDVALTAISCPWSDEAVSLKKIQLLTQAVRSNCSDEGYQ